MFAVTMWSFEQTVCFLLLMFMWVMWLGKKFAESNPEVANEGKKLIATRVLSWLARLCK